jgi:hypothetical protein
MEPHTGLAGRDHELEVSKSHTVRFSLRKQKQKNGGTGSGGTHL